MSIDPERPLHKSKQIVFYDDQVETVKKMVEQFGYGTFTMVARAALDHYISTGAYKELDIYESLREQDVEQSD